MNFKIIIKFLIQELLSWNEKSKLGSLKAKDRLSSQRNPPFLRVYQQGKYFHTELHYYSCNRGLTSADRVFVVIFVVTRNRNNRIARTWAWRTESLNAKKSRASLSDLDQQRQAG